jgi:hypothetical protein
MSPLTQLDLSSMTNGQERQQQRDYYESHRTVTTNFLTMAVVLDVT